jgi:hypothetical protein
MIGRWPLAYALSLGEVGAIVTAKGATMKAVLAVGLLLLSFSAAGQSRQSDRDRAIADFAKDLAALESNVQASNARAATLRGAVPAIGDRRDTGVLKEDAIARTEPRDGAAAITSLPAGKPVKIVGQTADWSGVLLSSGGDQAQVGWVRQGSVATSAMSGEYASFTNRLMAEAIEQAKELVDKYRANPYVRISGFSAEAGFPSGVSLSVQFEIK